MFYGEVFKILKDKNINIWLEYTKHEFIQKLANDIIEAQEKEIADMKAMIKRLENEK